MNARGERVQSDRQRERERVRTSARVRKLMHTRTDERTRARVITLRTHGATVVSQTEDLYIIVQEERIPIKNTRATVE